MIALPIKIQCDGCDRSETDEIRCRAPLKWGRSYLVLEVGGVLQIPLPPGWRVDDFDPERPRVLCGICGMEG